MVLVGRSGFNQFIRQEWPGPNGQGFPLASFKDAAIDEVRSPARVEQWQTSVGALVMVAEKRVVL